MLRHAGTQLYNEHSEEGDGYAIPLVLDYHCLPI